MKRALPLNDAERLWAAMLVAFPVIVGNDIKQAPQGAAQLVREHAEALLAEWKHRTRRPPADPEKTGPEVSA